MTVKLVGRRYGFVIDADGEEDKVDDASACPQCGECHVDKLETRDDGSVRCATCGTVYEL